MALEEKTRLTKSAVVEQALALADAEGPEALTIRRLADQLGVTPMAIYWHFKNKDQLLTAVAERLMGEVRSDRDPDAPWQEQLRSMVEALVRVVRVHPSGPMLLSSADMSHVDAFNEALDIALGLLREAGFTLEEGFQVGTFLLKSSIGLVEREPGRLPGMSPEEAAEWVRRRKLSVQALPTGRFPRLVEYAECNDPLDLEEYYAFGVDLMLAGVETVAARRAAPPSR